MNKKSKLSNCNQCPLFEQDRVLGETNCEDDLSKVDVLILAEAPAQTEVNKNMPLVDKAGKTFRKEFSESGLDSLNYLITNTVLCANLKINHETNKVISEASPEEAVDMCKTHWQTLIDITKPKFIFIMGGTTTKIFNIKGQITQIRGEFFDYTSPTSPDVECKIFVTLHPSYINRGSAPQEHVDAFKQDFRSLYFAITGKEQGDIINKNTTRDLLHLNKPYVHEIPSWMKTDDVCLVDAQKYPLENKILFIMRDKEGKRLYHKFNADEYYYYEKEESIGNAPLLAPIHDVGLVQSNNKNSKLATYESDVKPEVKYTIDYYLQREKEEPTVPLKKMFFDIEVFNNFSKAFPNPKQAVAPINAISFKVDSNKTQAYIVEPTNFKEVVLDKFDTYDITFFKNEKELLYAFMDFVRKTEPDVLAGWNVIGFDIPYIYNRLLKKGMDVNKMSPMNYFFVNIHKYNDFVLSGIYVLDMLELYKTLTLEGRETYKLGAIATLELGEGKVEYEGSLDELYMKDLNKFIRYSGQDTVLLSELDDKLGHIDLKNELRRICSSTWKFTESTTGQVDPLCISYAKKQGLVCRTADIHTSDSKFVGAYVRNPIPGIHSWLIDLDFTSLYPSIIMSCNMGPDTYIGKIDKDILERIKK